MLVHLASRLLSARSALLRVFRVSDWQITLLWAVVAGLAGAAATEGFRLLLDGVSTLVFGPHTGMVDIARKTTGCIGARMTGAGFGGCAVALVEAGNVETFTHYLNAAYTKATGLKPAIYVTRATAGASLEA